jgi:capsular polysaccharide biosynthesis protein
MNQSFNLISFLKLLWKWKKPIGIVVAIGIVGSIIISDPHFMPPYYESITTIYPLNPNLTQSSNLFGDNAQGYFGTNADIDRILSIAGSVPLKLFLVNKFDLFKHYKIDSAKERYPVEAVLRELHENYNFEKNDRGAIEITVWDRDPHIASEMANAIVAKIDLTNQELLNDNKKKILSIYEAKLNEKEAQVQMLSDSIFNLKQRFRLYSSIEDLPSQIKATRSELGADFDAATEKVKLLEEQKKGALRELNNNTVEYEQYKSTISSDVPTVYILEKAFPAEKKSKPVRWLIVLGTALASFVLASLAMLLIERFQNIKAAFTENAQPAH